MRLPERPPCSDCGMAMITTARSEDRAGHNGQSTQPRVQTAQGGLRQPLRRPYLIPAARLFFAYIALSAAVGPGCQLGCDMSGVAVVAPALGLVFAEAAEVQTAR